MDETRRELLETQLLTRFNASGRSGMAATGAVR